MKSILTCNLSPSGYFGVDANSQICYNNTLFQLSSDCDEKWEPEKDDTETRRLEGRNHVPYSIKEGDRCYDWIAILM